MKGIPSLNPIDTQCFMCIYFEHDCMTQTGMDHALLHTQSMKLAIFHTPMWSVERIYQPCFFFIFAKTSICHENQKSHYISDNMQYSTSTCRKIGTTAVYNFRDSLSLILSHFPKQQFHIVIKYKILILSTSNTEPVYVERFECFVCLIIYLTCQDIIIHHSFSCTQLAI